MLDEQCATLCEMLPNPAMILRADGTIVAANDKVSRLIGENSQLIGSRLVAHVSDPPRLVEDLIRTAARTREAVPGRLTLASSNLPLHCRANLALPPSTGRPGLVLLDLSEDDGRRFVELNRKIDELGREVDRRREIEQGFHEAQTRNAAILRATIEAVVTVGESGSVDSLNGAAEELFGLVESGVSGHHLLDLLVQSDEADSVYARCNDVFETGDDFLLERRIKVLARSIDGRVFPAELFLTRVATDDGCHFTALFRDITREQEAQKALEEQFALAALGRDLGFSLTHAGSVEDTLKTCTDLLVQHLDCAFARIWLLDAENATLELKSSSGMYTHLDGEHRSIPLGQFKIGRIAASGQPHLTNSVVGDPQVHDQEWARREGIVSFAGFPLKLEERVVGVLALFSRHLLSEHALRTLEAAASAIALGLERKRIEADLWHHAKALEDADRRKDDFLALLGHELRNPLAPLQTGLELIERGHVQEETIETMKRQLRHMSRLVDDLLDVSRIMRGKIPLQRRRVCVGEIVDRAVETVKPVVESQNHQFSIELEDESLSIEADPERLGQVLTNLLNNASKYTPEGGRIELKVKRGKRDDVVFRVRDNGIGIEPEFLPQLFAPFAQANVALDHAAGGLGLGLTLARRLVLMHGGKIRAHSKGIGQGAEFVFTLPRAAEATGPESETSAPKRSENGGKQKVLVVDDSQEAAELLRDLLTVAGGHHVEVAFDAFAALEVASSFKPEIVFLDIGLPEMDGYEVARRLRKMPECASSTIVALTGFGTDADRARSNEAGFDRHLVKPVTFELLQEILSLESDGSS